ncbi:MAG: hypothetical protein JWM56_180 [Candidatus Peribacteria bacterium]|nr:hypothetical protein [Candidatus Peribacteria bacterium]
MTNPNELEPEEPFIRKHLRQRIAGIEAKKEKMWNIAERHSTQYSKVLDLSAEEMKLLAEEREPESLRPDTEELASQGFVQVPVDGEWISLVAQHVCGLHYDNKWREMIFAICSSEPSLNTSIGKGTTLLSVLPEQWHRKLMEVLESPNRPEDWGNGVND